MAVNKRNNNTLNKMKKVPSIAVGVFCLLLIYVCIGSFGEKKRNEAGPIGTNPLTYIFADATIESLKINYLGVGTSADSLVVHNNTTKQLSRIAAPKRVTAYSGTTNVSGNYTVVFPVAYAVTPNIQANIVGGTALQRSIITSISTTGFTVQSVSQNTNTLLGIINLVSGTTVVNGSNIDVLITEK